MKRFFNVCAILLAICLAASFVSCKNDDDDDDDSSVVTSDSSGVTADSSDSSVVAVYRYMFDSDDIETYTFYNDNTVTRVSVTPQGTQTVSGTWEGSLSGTGTIILNIDGAPAPADFSVSGNTMTIGGAPIEYTKQ